MLLWTIKINYVSGFSLNMLTGLLYEILIKKRLVLD